jgi:hypothetical protein
MTKTWFDGENIVTQEIPEAELYKREWVGLTDEEIIDIRRKTTIKTHEAWADTKEFSRAIEAKLKAKNV